jgi:hypothetical protein
VARLVAAARLDPLARADLGGFPGLLVSLEHLAPLAPLGRLVAAARLDPLAREDLRELLGLLALLPRVDRATVVTAREATASTATASAAASTATAMVTGRARAVTTTTMATKTIEQEATLWISNSIAFSVFSLRCF